MLASILLCMFGLGGAIAVAMVALAFRRLLYDRLREHNTRLRRRALDALMRNPDAHIFHNTFARPAGMKVLLEALSLVRGAECDAMVAAAACSGAPTALARALNSRVARHRILAAEALGYFPGPATEAALSRAVRDRDARVQVAALKSLVQVDAPASLTLVMEIMQRHGKGRSSALSGVLRQWAVTRPGEIAAALHKEASVSGQLALIDAVAYARSAASAPHLAALAQSRLREIQSAALQALARSA